VVTLLSADERLRVDAAGQGHYVTLHRESIDDVVRDVRARPLGGILLSVSSLGGAQTALPAAARVAELVREFPHVPTVALVTDVADPPPDALLALGRSGVSTVVDARRPDGWRHLRAALGTDGLRDLERRALALVAQDLADAPESCTRFFHLLFAAPPQLVTVRALADLLHAVPSTLMSRFFRAGLPTPKRYLAFARLTRAARLLEAPGRSIASAANHLDYSSPQSFGRHVRVLLGLTATDFRHRFDGEGMLLHFRAELVLPYRERLLRFRPVGRY
jgi:AraC-like DNA-binding protein